MKVISANNLTKYYGDLLAVDDVSFEVEDKQVFGIIGPNGAGKTTLISMLSSQILPSRGSAFVDGKDVASQRLEVKRSIGLVPEEINLPSFLTVREYLEFVADTYGVKDSEVTRQINFFGIERRAEILCKDLSRGEKERLMLASAFIHEPKVALLDEPFLGIDPITQANFKKFMKNYAKKRTIIFCTHFLDLAKELCESVAILKEGRLVAVEETASIKEMESFFLKRVK